MSSFGDAIGIVASAQAKFESEQREVLECWRKVRSGESLTKEEKTLCRWAYTKGTLPKVPNYDLYQWVEDNCPLVG